MKNFPFQKDGKTYWYSRGICCVSGVFCKDKNGDIYVLANKRGDGSTEEQFKWNMPVGHLDFDETCAECAVREIFEETGIKVKVNHLRLLNINSKPDRETQNVTFRYIGLLPGTIDNYQTNLRHMEYREAISAKWINVSDIDNYNWAWNHYDLIHKFYYKVFNKKLNN